MSKVFCLWIGGLFCVLALLELLFQNPFGGWLRFTIIHNAFNWAVGFALLAVAANKNLSLARICSLSTGIVLVAAFAATKFFPVAVSDLLGYPLTAFYNFIHLTAGIF